jgi:hypothetical protein
MIMRKNLWQTAGALICAATALFITTQDCGAVDQTFELIQTETAVYSNVTVTTKSKEYIVIQHASGLTSLKVAELPPDLHEALGYGTSKSTKKNGLTLTAKAKEMAGTISTEQFKQAWNKHSQGGSPAEMFAKLDKKILFTVLGVFAAVYLFFCFCASLICKKAGKPGGLLVWLPVLQYIPLLRAARMSPLWLLAMFVPLLNIVAHILWSFKIAGVRGQGIFTAIFLILPTYPLAFMYLAFAGGASPDGESDELNPAPTKLSLGRA